MGTSFGLVSMIKFWRGLLDMIKVELHLLLMLGFKLNLQMVVVEMKIVLNSTFLIKLFGMTTNARFNSYPFVNLFLNGVPQKTQITKSLTTIASSLNLKNLLLMPRKQIVDLNF